MKETPRSAPLPLSTIPTSALGATARALHPHHRPRAEAQAARRDLALEGALTKLDRFDLIILDDISYARKDQTETSVLFELIARRYETRSLAIAASQPFSAWDRVFPDQAVTVAAIDRLVHHAPLLETNADSYHRRAVEDRLAHGADAAAAADDDKLANSDNLQPADNISDSTKEDVTA